MLHSVYPAGHEWEPHAEAQIYFIKTGTATLESHDRRGNAIVITRAMLNINVSIQAHSACQLHCKGRSTAHAKPMLNM